MSSISVVIPVRNGAATIDRCMQGIMRQTVQPQEVIVLDSASTDDTLERVARYPKVRTIGIKPGEFNHGLTRNLGASQSKGEIVVMTVQDAWPRNEFWLESLTQPFYQEDVVAVCGGQVVPHLPDFDPVSWHFPCSKPTVRFVQFAGSAAFDACSAEDRKSACSWDNVNAAYRASVLCDRLPFCERDFAEDAAWARDALRAGLKLAYAPEAAVFHWHFEDFDFLRRRYIAEQYHRYELFQWIPPKPRVGVSILRAARVLLRRPLTPWQRWHWWKYNYHNILYRSAAYREVIRAIRYGTLSDLYHKVCHVVPQSGPVPRARSCGE